MDIDPAEKAHASNTPQELRWAQLLALLAQNKKCTIKTLDTVIISNSAADDVSWYFTNKSGALSKKKKENCSIAGIVDRFSRFALSNPFNGIGYTGFIVDASSNRRALTQPELQKFLEQNWGELQSANAFLQVYLRPHRGEDLSVSARCSRAGNSYSFQFVSNALLCCSEGSEELKASAASPKKNANPDLASQQIRHQIQCSAHTIFDHLREHCSIDVLEATIDFIVDDNQHAWLCCIPQCAVVPSPQSRQTSPKKKKTDAAVESSNRDSPSTKDAAGTTNETPSSAQRSPRRKNETRETAKQQQSEERILQETELTSKSSAVPAKESRDVHVDAAPMAEKRLSKLNVKKDIIQRKKIQGNSNTQAGSHTDSNTAAPENTAAKKLSMAYNNEEKDAPSRGKRSTNSVQQDVGNKKASDPGVFRQSAMDAPPSIDMLAKFAAERDRQNQLLLQQQEVENAQRFGMQPQTSNAGPNRGKRGKKGIVAKRAAGLGLGSQIPSLDSAASHHLDATERRLEELQKIAATTASLKSYVQQQQGSDATTGMYGASNITGETNLQFSQSAMSLKRPNISGTEADFLVRQINSADVAQLSLLSNPDEFESVTAGLDARSSATVAYNNQQPADKKNASGAIAAAVDISKLLNQNNSGPRNPKQRVTGKSNEELIAEEHRELQKQLFGVDLSESTDGLDPKFVVSKLSEALKSRITTLEEQVENLSQNIVRKEAELEERNAKIRRLQGDVTKAKQEGVNNVKELQTIHEKEILKIREIHAKEKSALAIGVHSSVGGSSQQSSPSSKTMHGLDAHSDVKLDGNSKLIEQVERLRTELRRAQDAAAEERRHMQIEHTNKLMSQERKLKAELTEMRSMYAQLEDKYVSSGEDLLTANSRIESLQRVNAQLEAAKNHAIETQQHLRSDLKNMQQSVQASYRLESAQGIGVGTSGSDSGVSAVDAETAIRLNDAKNEAKSRQLTNKLEFLKAQLDSEKKASDEARRAMELSQKKLEEMRDDFKLRMQEADNEKRLAVEEAEQALDLQYQDRMKELTTLQMRLMSIEGQLNSAQEQEILAKQREEQAKITAGKAQASQAQLRVESEQLRSQLQQLRDEKEAEMIKEAGKQNHEAIIRRLDNERQYLKSQLASEITHKTELQSELVKSQQQLGEIQNQWKADISALKDSALTAKHAADEKEQKLTESLTHSMSELNRVTAQNKELKDGFVKMRDQVRMEQLSLETANTTQRRLQENLEESRGEINRLREQERQTAELHQTQIEALNDTLKEQERRSSEEIQHLKAELSSQFMDNSRAHSATILLRDQFEVEKLKLKQLAGAQKIVNSLKRWQIARVHGSFRVWHSNTSLVGAAKQFRVQVETLLKKNTKDMNAEKATALDTQKLELDSLHKREMADRDAQWEETMNTALTEAEQQKQNELSKLRDEHAAAVKQLEADFLYDLQQARKEGEEEVLKAIARKDKEIEFLERDYRVRMEMAMDDAKQEKEMALQKKHDEMTKLMHENLQRQEEHLLEEQKKLMLRTKAEHEAKLEAHENQLRTEAQRMKEELMAKHMEATERMQQKHAMAMTTLEENLRKTMDQQRQELLAQNEKEQHELREAMREAEEKRIRKLRAEWTADTDTRISQLKASFKASMEQYVKEKEAEMVRAIEEEAAKWQQELEKQQKVHELDTIKLREELADEMRKESERLTAKYDQLRAEDKKIHEEAMETLKSDQAATLERLQEKHKNMVDGMNSEFERKSKEAEANWNERLKLELQNAELNWKGKLAKEQARLDQLKNDMAQQAQHHAAERANLQRQVDRADERIRQMEMMNKAEIASIQKNFESERLAWRKQREEEIKAARKEAEEEKKEAILHTREQCAAEHAEHMKEEQARWTEEFNSQMHQMQQENDALIGNFEGSVSDLQQKKKQLETDLEALGNKLQETEDNLYDAQQELKQTQLSSSLTVWKSLAKIFQMRLRFQEGIAEFDREAAQKYKEIEEAMQKKLNAAELIACRLAALLQNVEVDRQETREILTSHRTGELMQTRKQIESIEKDLERLTMEKDSLEEQRELVDVDVAQMEQQVRVLEDQIRAHNQESSMVNGRINVAHARKKRRLDSELEHFLESIEQKRASVSSLEKRCMEKAHERDDLELQMIDLERNLVQILLEQQKLVMGKLEDAQQFEVQSRDVLQAGRIPFPVPAEPTIAFIENVVIAERKKREKQGIDW